MIKNKTPITIAAATVTFLLGTAISWAQLGLPTMVFSTHLDELRVEVASYKRYNDDTRILILQVQLRDFRTELENIRIRQEAGVILPTDAGRKAELDTAIESLVRQIKGLYGTNG